MDFDDQYLNKTPNKSQRGSIDAELVVWHETASPNPSNPHGTLQYNLRPNVQSSYNYLIARDGTIYRYVDEVKYIAWHAGKNSRALGYVNAQLNTRSIGVEIDGKNNGEPITAAQRDAAIRLMRYFQSEYGIALDRDVHLHHKEVAPGYKSDPRGYSVDTLLQLANTEHDHSVDSCCEACPAGLRYVVKANLANVRQGPTTQSSTASQMRAGEVFVAKDIVNGEELTIGGITDDRWLHRADDLGFMWIGLVKRA